MTRANDDLKKLEGLDPEKARQALAAQQKAEEEKAKAEGHYEQLRSVMTKAHPEEKAALEGIRRR